MAESTGLLDFLNSPGGMGLLSAVGSGLAGARRGGTWNAVGSGLLGGVQGYAQGQDLQRQNEYATQRGKLFDMQAQQLEQQQAAAKAEAESKAARLAYLGSVGKVTSPRLDAQPNKFDPMQFVRLSGSIDEAQKLAGMGDWGRAEVARTIESQDAQGNKIILQRDKFGRPAGDVVQGYTAPVQVDLGGRVQFVKPQAGVNLTKTMTPGEVAANQRARESAAIAAQSVTYQQDADGNFVALPTKIQPGSVVRGLPVVSGPGMSPLKGASKLGEGTASEDERKAAGWLAQASTAWANMQKAMGGVDPKTGKFKNPDVAMPGMPDAIAAIPSFGLGEVVGNTMRAPARQQFIQASSSMGEAILRAATGAGMNQYEAEQKVRELTPVFGEDPSTTEQKMQTIPIYLQSLRARAGRAAPKDWSVPVENAPSDGSDWSIRPK